MVHIGKKKKKKSLRFSDIPLRDLNLSYVHMYKLIAQGKISHQPQTLRTQDVKSVSENAALERSQQAYHTAHTDASCHSATVKEKDGDV